MLVYFCKTTLLCFLIITLSTTEQKQPFLLNFFFRSSLLQMFFKIDVLKNSQYSQENTCVGVSFLIKLLASRPATLLKKRLQHRCFPVNIENFLRTPFFTEHLRWLLLFFANGYSQYTKVCS